MPSPSSARRGEYGFDAPYAVFGLLMAALPPLVAGVIFWRQPWGKLLLAAGVAGSISTALYLHATRRGKFAVWARELAAVGLAGSERVVDLGCGRGAVLTMAAELVPDGAAVGVDLWRSADQSGNRAEVTRANAAAEAVADRVTLVTADLRELPFADGEFDLAVSSLAVHNISDADGRARAVREAARVLRPGGRLVIADMARTSEYAATLRALGFAVTHRRSGWRGWFGGPWTATAFVTARKPSRRVR
ncbi:class I SAM-dependent methyltransferase [Pseudonocardia acaciae]|uniref:class I SAM-dependent methyltransferase n=1 Tax=Pseudonocardia acaciae TaxID=551276 RepID=UPI00048C29A2|nr:class I SAM-dependent methyltransferase [Pseudonocardia acaciae]